MATPTWSGRSSAEGSGCADGPGCCSPSGGASRIDAPPPRTRPVSCRRRGSGRRNRLLVVAAVRVRAAPAVVELVPIDRAVGHLGVRGVGGPLPGTELQATGGAVVPRLGARH